MTPLLKLNKPFYGKFFTTSEEIEIEFCKVDTLRSASNRFVFGGICPMGFFFWFYFVPGDKNQLIILYYSHSFTNI